MSSSSAKVTDNTHEMSFHELFSQSRQIRIPLFQREYVWGEKQLKRLLEEIDLVVSGEDTNRFLGAIIAVSRDANPATPQPFEIVDGQQRLTTLYLMVLAAAYVAAKHENEDYAFGLINSNLIIDWWKGGANTKLISSYADRAQLNSAFSQLMKLGSLEERLTGRIVLPPTTGSPSGRLLGQFTRIRQILTKRCQDHGIEHLQEMVTAAQTKLSFVFILLKDPSNATTVFEGLNDPGIPIGIGDLVRNEVFSKISEDPSLANQVHEMVWLPFRHTLGEHFDEFFFTFGIVKEPSIRRADLFRGLRKIWGKNDDPKVIIDGLLEYVPTFLALTTGHCPASYSRKVVDRISRLIAANMPSSTHPFLVRLLKEYELGTCEDVQVVETLKVLESFLVRRAIVGIEPTGLLVFFRTAWTVMEGKPNGANFAEALRKRSTIEWPDDERVKKAVTSRRIYKSTIRNFLLAEYDRSLGGDVPANIPWVEHVLPQKLNEVWAKAGFTKDSHEELVDTWGNLVPLSREMNIDASQSEFSKKRKLFSEGSMYKSARELADQHQQWTPAEIRARSVRIGAWAVDHWPRGG